MNLRGGTVSTVACALLACSIIGAAAPDHPLVHELRERSGQLLHQVVEGTRKEVLGRDGWVLLVSELRYLVAGTFFGNATQNPNPALGRKLHDPIPAVLDFNRQLADRGIHLIYMPVPVRPQIYPESILGRDRIAAVGGAPDLYPEQTAYYRQLSRKGVDVVDLTPLLVAHRDDPHGPICVPSDSHWTPLGAWLAAREIARKVAGEPWLARAPRHQFQIAWKQKQHFGHIYRDLRDRAGLDARPPDTIWIREVFEKTPEGPAAIQRRHPNSPVVLIGDSETIWWTTQENSGLPQQLASELGFPVDVLSTVGGGDTNSRINLVREARATPGYLETKKLVIWCFSARTTVEGRAHWRLTPLAPAPSQD